MPTTLPKDEPHLNKWHWLLLALGLLICARSPVLLLYLSAALLFLYWFYWGRHSKNTLAILFCLCLALFFVSPLLPLSQQLQPLSSLDRWMYLLLTLVFAGAAVVFYVARRQYQAALKQESLPEAPPETVWETDDEDDEEDDYDESFPYQDEDIWEDDDDEEE